MKLTHLSLAVMVALGLAACGGSSTDHTKTPPKKEEPKKEDPKKEEPKKDKDTQDPTGLDTVVGFDMTKTSSVGTLQQIRQEKASFNRRINKSDATPGQATGIVSVPLNERLANIVVAQIDAKTLVAWVKKSAIGRPNQLTVASGNIVTKKPADADLKDYIKINVSAYSAASEVDVTGADLNVQTIQTQNRTYGIRAGNVSKAGPPPVPARSSTIIFPTVDDANGNPGRRAQEMTKLKYKQADHSAFHAAPAIKDGDAYVVSKVRGNTWQFVSGLAKSEVNQWLAPLWLDHLGRAIASEDDPDTKVGVRVYGYKYGVYNNGKTFTPNSFSGADIAILNQKGKYRITSDGQYADAFGNALPNSATLVNNIKAAKAALKAAEDANAAKAVIDARKATLKTAQDALDAVAKMDRNQYALRLRPITLQHVQYGRVTSRLDEEGAYKYVQVGNKWIRQHIVADKNSTESVDTYFYRGLNPTSPTDMAKLDKSRKLNYAGHALMYGISNQYGASNAIPNATGASPGQGVGHLVKATFDVGKQTVTGNVYNAWLLDTSNSKSYREDKLVNFSGKVTGNTVLGEAELAKNTKSKADFRGSFYGAGATELGGSFNSVRAPKKGEKDAKPYGPRGWGGVFGAQRAADKVPAVGVLPKYEEGQ